MFCSKCGVQVADDAQFCSKCGSKLVGEMVSVQETEVKSPSNVKIKEYLGHAKRLELHRYSLTVAKERLQEKIDALGHNKTFYEPIVTNYTPFKAFIPAFFIALAIGLLLSALICQETSESFFTNLLSMVTIYPLFSNTELATGVLIALGVAVVVGIVFGIRNVSKTKAEFEAQKKAYQNDIAKDNERVEREKEQIEQLKKQQAELSVQIAKLDEIREKLYALNVVEPKYRDLLPIVMMHEYFETERCYSLTGPDGAYNLYESELLQKKIGTDLSQIANLLVDIEQNQQDIYDSIKNSSYYAEVNIY